MKTDRELLELAAKAAGLKLGKPLVFGSCFQHLIGGFNLDEDNRLIQRAWNPLTDDGDALRLAVACKMEMALFSAYALDAVVFLDINGKNTTITEN